MEFATSAITAITAPRPSQRVKPINSISCPAVSAKNAFSGLVLVGCWSDLKRASIASATESRSPELSTLTLNCVTIPSPLREACCRKLSFTYATLLSCGNGERITPATYTVIPAASNLSPGFSPRRFANCSPSKAESSRFSHSAAVPSIISISGAYFVSRPSGTPRNVTTSRLAPQLLTRILIGITSRTFGISRISSA